MTTEATTETPLRKFSVLYAVTRGEYYEIEAADEQEAKEKGFTDGTLAEQGETTDVVDCEVEEIPAFTPPSDDERVKNAAQDLLDELLFVCEKADDLMAAIDGATDQFESEAGALAKAVREARKITDAATSSIR